MENIVGSKYSEILEREAATILHLPMEYVFKTALRLRSTSVAHASNLQPGLKEMYLTLLFHHQIYFLQCVDNYSDDSSVMKLKVIGFIVNI